MWSCFNLANGTPNSLMSMGGEINVKINSMGHTNFLIEVRFESLSLPLSHDIDFWPTH